MPATHSAPTRVASVLPLRVHAVRAAPQARSAQVILRQWRKLVTCTHLFPTRAAKPRRVDWIELRRWNSGREVSRPGLCVAMARRRNEVLVGDHHAVGDLRRIGRASTRRPRSRSPHPVAVIPEALKLQQVPDDGFAGRAAEPVGPLASDTLVAADCCVHRVLLALRQAEISNELPAALGPKGTAEEEC